MIKVTFVCLGNICRSPVAELVFKKLIREKGVEDMFEVSSCGTSGCEAGSSIYPPAAATLSRHGVEGSHTARKITRKDIEDSDYILVMDDDNMRGLKRVASIDEQKKIFKLCSFTSRPRDVADPWYTRDFETAYADILDGCTAFLEKVSGEYGR
ncbi:MAG: low molecular weight phosphotyrosine protein phosphatase [Clostridia bacterium]|nr:low molecular weight phosphotyrosine protein phosphatase [Clostridia bacterium]